MRQKPHEIVQVLSGNFLIDPTRHVCPYGTRYGQPLGPGFYFVLWPVGTISACYDHRAQYFGPFVRKTLAATLMTSAASLSLIEPTEKAPADAGDRSYAKKGGHVAWANRPEL